MAEDHEPIIDRATFDAVQKEIRWRAAMVAPAMNGEDGGEKCDSRKPDKPSASEMVIPMICGICGKRYRRKITRRGTAYAAPVWICSTYNYRGKAYCASKQIPEPILLEMVTAALGNRHTEDEVDHLEVCPNNRVLFAFRDGRTEEHVWKDHSRKDSWNTDMRKKSSRKDTRPARDEKGVRGTVSEANRIEPVLNRPRTVTVIPSRVLTLPGMPPLSVRPKQVAAYARVSTNSEEQLTSYEAQVKHYTEYIKSRALTDHWRFVDVYTDKGITGTSMAKREGFNRMMQDALAGKIDLIITKSVSRFARNTVDTLTAIRRLKEHGVEVYFEEQNIYTLDGKGELLLTIMSSIAQEESRNISENVTWGIRKRFADGKVSMPYKRFMGYRRGEDGGPEIVEAEAKIVRSIFRRFLEGATSTMIAKELNEANVPCPAHKSQLGEDEIEAEKADRKKARWSASTVESILTNKKYKGDAILQKTYCTDYIQKTFVENDGSEIPKYYAQNSHPAIVSAEVFDLTQMEMEWRKSLNGSYSGKSCFASRVVCGDCGAFYGSKVWHSTDAYRRIIWRCNGKYTGEKKCTTPYVTQDELEKAFVSVLQRVLREKEAITAACRETLEGIDTVELDAEVGTRLENEASSIAERLRRLVEENARVRRDQKEFQCGYDRLVVEYDRINAQIQAMENQNRNKERAKRKLEILLGFLEKMEACEAFESFSFATMVEKVVVGRDGRLEFFFRNGMRYEHQLNKGSG